VSRGYRAGPEKLLFDNDQVGNPSQPGDAGVGGREKHGEGLAQTEMDAKGHFGWPQGVGANHPTSVGGDFAPTDGDIGQAARAEPTQGHADNAGLRWGTAKSALTDRFTIVWSCGRLSVRV